MSTQKISKKKKFTVKSVAARKRKSVPMSMVTAYDFAMATLVEKAGIDMILVGDSLAMTMLGYDSTVPVTMDDMILHCKSVVRGATTPLIVGDLPFMSYQVDKADAIRNAGRLMKEGGVDCVKLEGGVEIAETARAIVNAGIPVMGHIGLTPQSVSQLGGYRVQGKTADSAHKLINDALALQEAGCFAIVLEAMPTEVAQAVTNALRIPTIGIGAGNVCDGQVLVIHDMLGMFDKLHPRFVKKYANVGDIIVDALASYKEEVTERTFPAEEHTYAMKDGEEISFKERVNGKK